MSFMLDWRGDMKANSLLIRKIIQSFILIILERKVQCKINIKSFDNIIWLRQKKEI